MKKYIIIFLLIILTGCVQEKETQEEIFTDIANKYYENHLKGDAELNEFILKIIDIKEANQLGVASYELKNLEQCTDESSVTLTIDNKTQKITNYSFSLDCK